MTGLAKTGKFMLGTATVMLGPQSELMDLTPSAHSIGLVKNFSMTAEPKYTDLTQGVKNTVVASVLTSNPVRASMEVYEFTGKNLAYGLGLDGSAMTAQTVETTLGTAVDYSASPVTEITVVSAASLNAGDWIQIQEGADDEIEVRKVASKASNALTLDRGLKRDFASGSAVRKVNVIGVGSKTDQPFLSAKIVGTLVDNSEVVILIPKLRIVKGFTMAFDSEKYGNLPFEFTVYDQVSSDPFYSDFSGDSARIFAQG